MKVLTAAMLVAILLAFAGCGNKDKAPQQSETTETTASVPEIGLHAAVVAGDLEAIRQHINAGSDLNEMEPTRASTPLITAAAFGKPEAAKLLIDAGAELNYQNDDGSTALHTAVAFGNTEVAKLLIDAGIGLNIKNKEGATALHTAAFFGNKEIVEVMLEKGADKTIKNGAGKTAYETVEAPFEEVKSVYDAVGAGLAPIGVKLDYDQIKAARPEIAEMLK